MAHILITPALFFRIVYGLTANVFGLHYNRVMMCVQRRCTRPADQTATKTLEKAVNPDEDYP